MGFFPQAAAAMGQEGARFYRRNEGHEERIATKDLKEAKEGAKFRTGANGENRGFDLFSLFPLFAPVQYPALTWPIIRVRG
jgi:hypothetical protein